MSFDTQLTLGITEKKSATGYRLDLDKDTRYKDTSTKAKVIDTIKKKDEKSMKFSH